MRWPKTWAGLLDPEAKQELDMESLALALNASTVRVHWLQEVLATLAKINLEIDKMVERNDNKESFIQVSAKRRAIAEVLQQILVSRNSVAMELHHNQGAVL